jgi:hypothetical protein
VAKLKSKQLNPNFTGSFSISGSLDLVGTSDLFTLYDNNDNLMFKIDNKMMVLGSNPSTPTAIEGGMFYSGSSEWFVGFDD